MVRYRFPRRASLPGIPPLNSQPSSTHAVGHKLQEGGNRSSTLKYKGGPTRAARRGQPVLNSQVRRRPDTSSNKGTTCAQLSSTKAARHNQQDKGSLCSTFKNIGGRNKNTEKHPRLNPLVHWRLNSRKDERHGQAILILS